MGKSFFTEDDRLCGMPNQFSGSDHSPVAAELQWLPIPKEYQPELSVEQKREIEVAAKGLGSPPPTTKGKPTTEQLVALKAWAVTKRDFLSNYEDPLETAYAKRLLK